MWLVRCTVVLVLCAPWRGGGWGSVGLLRSLFWVLPFVGVVALFGFWSGWLWISGGSVNTSCRCCKSTWAEQVREVVFECLANVDV